jgi:hypothetical protein
MDRRLARYWWAAVIVTALAFASPTRATSCDARDFLAEDLDAAWFGPPWLAAVLLAYPTLRAGPEAGTLVSDDGRTIAVTGPTARPPRERLSDATLGDHVVPVYPLSRDLDARRVPFHDPGRARNSAFLALLYGDDAAEVSATLVTVPAGPGGTARFRVTARQGVACQLTAAMADLAEDWEGLAPFFSPVAGGFNWRRIAGTNRLSAHAYGIAVDINAELGGYWRWSGAQEGAVGAFFNRVPWRLVEAMERRGFIWGGKWHHFDGMHFEYRPEVILYSRLVRGAQQETGGTP